MHGRRIAVGVVLGALALAGAASAQVNTACQVNGQWVYCNSTPTNQNGATTYGTGYGAQTILTPEAARDNAVRSQLLAESLRQSRQTPTPQQEEAHRQMVREGIAYMIAQHQCDKAKSGAIAAGEFDLAERVVKLCTPAP